MSSLPLQGITVVAMEQAIAAPFATRQLADLGARVIKIERLVGGDFARNYDRTVRGLSGHFVWVNRSKESVTLDVKRPEGQTVLSRLLANADVFIQNLAPGAAARLGTDAACLRARYPQLIVCTISGYGNDGPYAQKKAYDLLVQAEVGLLSITGTESTPSKVGISIADIAGGMYAYTGILTALLARTRTGKGTAIDVSLFDALAEWMGYPAYYAGYGGAEPNRTGASHASISPYGPFPTREGKNVYLAVHSEREWGQFCIDVLQRPDLVDDERFRSNLSRVENREALNAVIESVFRNLSADEIVQHLDKAKIANARMNTVHEFLSHPQLSARGCWQEIDSPVGPLRTLRPPVRLTDVDPVMAPIPSLGQHTESVLRELGFDAQTISEWKAGGII